MKNYEIKNATEELGLSSKIVISRKRTAFLVVNMFNKLKSGFSGKMKALRASIESSPIAEDVAKAKESAELARVEANTTESNNVEEEKQAKIDKYYEVKENTNIPENVKNYILKSYVNEVAKLENKQQKISESPRRLLISTVFLQKLITNSRKRRQNEKLEKIIEAIPTQDPVDYYFELDDKRIELENQKAEIEQEIAEIRKKIVEVVRNNGITREMIQAKAK